MSRLTSIVYLIVSIVALVVISSFLYITWSLHWIALIVVLILFYPLPVLMTLVSIAALDREKRVRCLDKFRPRTPPTETVKEEEESESEQGQSDT